MADLETLQQKQEYIEKRYIVAWKAALQKLAALEAELKRAQQKCNISAPPGLPDDKAEEFAQLKTMLTMKFAKIDKLMGTIKMSSSDVTQSFARFKQTGF